ncbi:flagellar motor protein MotB [Fluviibacterium sp. DFM31]|uniref:Flagellar motor protein MotB n=1 Tax=Meridianimarinicoccus marinus TaxID=3231483 RepID=A0ABV3L523_9RHOB
MSDESLAPIVIKRKKVVVEGGHHGGAWKVAYADFVTAMMAFFLLMWLLNATTEKQRKGLADYFSPTIPINRVSGGGDGSFYGDSVFSTEELAQNGNGAANLQPTDQHQAKGETGLGSRETRVQDQTNVVPPESEDLLETLKLRGGESMARLLEQRHVVTRLSDAGLVFEIWELPESRLFGDDDAPTPQLKALLRQVTALIQLVTNDVSVAAHLAARPVVLADNPVWDRSTDRALAARKLIEKAGLDPARIQRVTGYGDSQPVLDNRMDLRNSRVEITVLRSTF